MKSNDEIEKLTAQFIEEWKSNKKLQAYLSTFEPKSTENFIRGYAHKKALWYKYSDLHIRKNEEEDTQWVEDGFEHLARIQQKKLFNLQCEWRAEKFTLEGIEISYDFRTWQRNIFNCPYIDPITAQEVEIYIEFLKQVNLEDDAAVEFWDDWQSYDELKAANDPDSQSYFSNYPEWYEYYDMRFGTGALLSLPDIRGQKEGRYMIACNKHREKMIAEKKATEKTVPKKPGLHKSTYDTGYLEWFIKTFEDAQTKKYYDANKRYSRVNEEADEIMENIELLLKSGETLPIQSNIDWIEGIKHTVNRYKTSKIIEFLPHTFEQYNIKREMNIFPDHGLDLTVRNLMLKLILDGREILGEPRDLDF